MYNTKFWVVTRDVCSSWRISDTSIIGLALTKQDAEFTADQLSKRAYKKWASDQYTCFSTSCPKYYVQEVSIVDFVDKESKEFKQFSKEKTTELLAMIAKNNECKDNDIKKNQELEKELETYK